MSDRANHDPRDAVLGHDSGDVGQRGVLASPVTVTADRHRQAASMLGTRRNDEVEERPGTSRSQKEVCGFRCIRLYLIADLLEYRRGALRGEDARHDDVGLVDAGLDRLLESEQ